MNGVPMGDGAVRLPRPPGSDAAAILELLAAWPGIVDAVVSEEHVLVVFDPLAPPDDPGERLTTCLDPPRAPHHHVVPVRYDGVDLEEVARASGLTLDEVVRAHAGRILEVKMLGFLPGFAYLGDVDPRLRLPRRSSPRPRVPAGAVALAGPYSAIYPFSSPGGWHLIGSAVGFDPFSPVMGATLRPGDRVTFRPEP